MRLVQCNNWRGIYFYLHSEHYMVNKTIMKNIRIPIIATISAAIFLATALASLISLSVLQPYDGILYAFGQTQEVAGGGRQQITNVVLSSSNVLSLSSLTSQDSPYQGSKSAPITVIDFSDLQCHLCARFVKNTEPKINETYIQTDKVALVFKHLPNRGFDSMPAALAAQCTQDQGKFWQFHNLLYEKQGPIDSGWANKDNLKKLAYQISGLDMHNFNSCFDSQKYKSFVESDIASAHSLGFTETPSFIIVKSDGSNPQKIERPQPFPAFKAVIDKELGRA
jgi:protein-disulfide isomerase